MLEYKVDYTAVIIGTRREIGDRISEQTRNDKKEIRPSLLCLNTVPTPNCVSVSCSLSVLLLG